MNPHTCPQFNEPVYLDWRFDQWKHADLILRSAIATCPHCGTRFVRIAVYLERNPGVSCAPNSLVADIRQGQKGA